LNKHELIIGHNKHNSKSKHKKNKKVEVKGPNRVENEHGHGTHLRNFLSRCSGFFSVNKWCECVLTSRRSNTTKKKKKKRVGKHNSTQVCMAHDASDEPVDDMDNEENEVEDDDSRVNDHMVISKHKSATNQKAKTNRNTIKTGSYSSDECISNPPPVTCIRVLRPSNDLTPVKFDSHYNIIQTLNAVQNCCANDLTMTYSSTAIEPNSASDDPVQHSDDIEELNETEELYFPVKISY
jgi:hypothetical protein